MRKILITLLVQGSRCGSSDMVLLRGTLFHHGHESMLYIVLNSGINLYLYITQFYPTISYLIEQLTFLYLGTTYPVLLTCLFIMTCLIQTYYNYRLRIEVFLNNDLFSYFNNNNYTYKILSQNIML